MSRAACLLSIRIFDLAKWRSCVPVIHRSCFEPGVDGCEGKRIRGVPCPAVFGSSIFAGWTFLAGACDQAGDGTLAICVHDISRGVTARVSPGPHDRFPVWCPDGREIAYNSNGGIYSVSADGSGTPTFVSNWGIPTDWFPDGRILAFGSDRGVVSLALWSPRTHELLELPPGGGSRSSP